MGDVQGYNKKYKSTTLRMWKNERDEAELLYDGNGIRVTLNGRNKAALIDSTTQVISGVYGKADMVNGVVSIQCEQGQSFITTSSISALISSETSAINVSLNIPSPSIVVRTTLTGSTGDFLISPYAESSETITPEAADLFDAQKADGYNAGDVVSYINENSPTPQFQTLQLYIAESDIAYEEFRVPSPEEVDLWLYRGDTIIQTTSTSTSTAFVYTPTDLRSITSPQPGHTVAVKSTATIYRFNPYSTFGGYAPFDGTTGRWIGFGTLSQQNLLVGVYTKENEGNGIFIPYGAKVLFLEMTEAGSNYCTIEDESSIEVLTITVTEPSIVTRIGNGYTLADFSIVPLGGSTTIINVNDADAFDYNKENGYPEGSIISYISVGADAPYNTLALYSALTDIPYIGIYPDGYVESPEQNGNWIWQGTEIDVPSNSGATVFVPSIAALRQITGYKIGDTVSVVQGFTYKYMNVGTFQNGVDQYPFDQVVQDGNCWTYRWSSDELALRPKISYSNVKYIIDGDDYDGATVTLDFNEGLILLNSISQVFINEQEFVNQPNCIIYRNSQGVLAQEALGGGETLISKTYSELAALVASNELVAGQQYLLTDYRTKHVIPNSSPVEINTGNLEPLILTAVDANSFHAEVKSTTFPTDIIHYRFDDDSCEDGTRDSANKKWTGGTARTGYIQYRKSTTNNLSTHYDWRNYKVRRWKLDAIGWASGMSLQPRDIIKVNDTIYVCIKSVSGSDVDPSLDTEHYIRYCSLYWQSEGAFLSPVNNKSTYIIGGISSNNLIINNTTPNTDYRDYYTFCILTELNNSSGIIETNINNGVIGQGFKDFAVGSFNFDRNQPPIEKMESNVFYLIPNGNNEYFTYSNDLGHNFTLNTVVSKFYNNIIGSDCHSNIILNNTFANYIRDSFHNNLIASDFQSNNISDDFGHNTIDYGFVTNDIGSHFLQNLISFNFGNNKIGIAFVNCSVGSGFSCNLIRSSFTNNTIGSYFYANSFFSDSLSSNIIGDNFRSNVVYCSFNSENFTISATHVYNAYNCNIFIRQDGMLRLSYYDNNDQLVITDVTA